MQPNHFRKYIIKTNPHPVEPEPLAIATPFYYSFPFLLPYLTALQKLDYPKELLTLIFAVQGDDGTYETLQAFKDQMCHRYHDIILRKREELIVEGTSQKRSMLNVCDQRNWLKQQTDTDILFIGHDNFPPPQTIKRLLEAQQLGADIAAGVYPFVKYDSLGFTSWFLEQHAGKQRATTGLWRNTHKLWFPSILLGQRAWTVAVGMDCTLIQREVLDALDFTVSLKEDISDDVEYCFKANHKRFRVLTDYGLWVPHWGFNLQFLADKVYRGYVQVICTVNPQLAQRRNMLRELRESQIHSHVLCQ